jgi:hypothetical protein
MWRPIRKLIDPSSLLHDA